MLDVNTFDQLRIGLATADSIRAALASSSPEWRSSIASDRIIASGLAIPFPAMSGALPWISS